MNKSGLKLLLAGQKGNLLLLTAAILGGIGYVAMKNILDAGFSPIQLVAGRYFIAVVTMGVFFFPQFRLLTKREMRGGFMMGLMLFCLFVMLTEGLKRTTPSINAFLSSTSAVIVPLLVWLIRKERPDKFVAAAAVMTGIGAALLSLTDHLELSLGALLSFGSAVMFSLHMIAIDRYIADCSPLRLTLVECITVMVLAFLSAAFFSPKIETVTWPVLGNFMISGVFCTFLYFLFTSMGQQYTTPSNASILITSEAVFGALASFVFYGEQVTAKLLIGGALIFLAVYVAEKKPVPGGKKLLTQEEK